MSTEIKNWANGDSCAASGYPGFYNLKLETQGECIWSTRLTANSSTPMTSSRQLRPR